jgi:hypothetical protein
VANRAAAVGGSGLADGAYAPGNTGRRHGLGRVEREGFFECTGTRENGAGIAKRRAASAAPARVEAPGLTLDRTVSAIRAVVCAPARSGLWTVRHVWLRDHHSGFINSRFYGYPGEEEKRVLRTRSQKSKLIAPTSADTQHELS